VSPKKSKKKSKVTKPPALDVSELEEGEIRDDEPASPAAPTATTTPVASASSSEPGKLASKPSKPSPTEVKQGWEFVEQAEVEEGEIVEDDEWIVDALTEATKTAAAVAGMWQWESPPPTYCCAPLASSTRDHIANQICFRFFKLHQLRQPVKTHLKGRRNQKRAGQSMLKMQLQQQQQQQQQPKAQVHR
jgi:hypothetical protein